ncbi:MAG: hypothetical protein IJU54_01190 [Alphaproteobacteria bacterium]|nr:hypothetical protein [Alphaproteobacteria bacterium]
MLKYYHVILLNIILTNVNSYGTIYYNTKNCNNYYNNGTYNTCDINKNSTLKLNLLKNKYGNFAKKQFIPYNPQEYFLNNNTPNMRHYSSLDENTMSYLADNHIHELQDKIVELRNDNKQLRNTIKQQNEIMNLLNNNEISGNIIKQNKKCYNVYIENVNDIQSLGINNKQPIEYDKVDNSINICDTKDSKTKIVGNNIPNQIKNTKGINALENENKNIQVNNNTQSTNNALNNITLTTNADNSNTSVSINNVPRLDSYVEHKNKKNTIESSKNTNKSTIIGLNSKYLKKNKNKKKRYKKMKQANNDIIINSNNAVAKQNTDKCGQNIKTNNNIQVTHEEIIESSDKNTVNQQKNNIGFSIEDNKQNADTLHNKVSQNNNAIIPTNKTILNNTDSDNQNNIIDIVKQNTHESLKEDKKECVNNKHISDDHKKETHNDLKGDNQEDVNNKDISNNTQDINYNNQFSTSTNKHNQTKVKTSNNEKARYKNKKKNKKKNKNKNKEQENNVTNPESEALLDKAIKDELLNRARDEAKKQELEQQKQITTQKLIDSMKEQEQKIKDECVEFGLAITRTDYYEAPNKVYNNILVRNESLLKKLIKLFELYESLLTKNDDKKNEMSENSKSISRYILSLIHILLDTNIYNTIVYENTNNYNALLIQDDLNYQQLEILLNQNVQKLTSQEINNKLFKQIISFDSNINKFLNKYNEPYDLKRMWLNIVKADMLYRPEQCCFDIKELIDKCFNKINKNSIIDEEMTNEDKIILIKEFLDYFIMQTSVYDNTRMYNEKNKIKQQDYIEPLLVMNVQDIVNMIKNGIGSKKLYSELMDIIIKTKNKLEQFDFKTYKKYNNSYRSVKPVITQHLDRNQKKLLSYAQDILDGKKVFNLKNNNDTNEILKEDLWHKLFVDITHNFVTV